MVVRRTAALALLLIGAGSSLVTAQISHLDWKLFNVGKIRQVVTNQGALNKGSTSYPGLIMCEFPPNSGEEHLYQGGIWVGAINPNGDTLVSETQSHYRNEFFPTSSKADSIWSVARGDTVQIPYWPNYVGISDQDFVCHYSDDNLLNIENHTPLNVEIIQASHGWSSPPVDEFLIHQYKIIAKKIPLKDVYIAFWMHSAVGQVNTANFIDELIRYYRDLHMAVAEDLPGGEDGTAISPIGFRVLTPNTAGLTWSMGYWEHETLPSKNGDEYRAMSSGVIMEDRLDAPARAHIILGFGPFQMKAGDTLKVEMAEVLGYGLAGLLKNANYIDFLKTKSYGVPAPPPRPVVTVTPRSHGIALNWEAGKVITENYTDVNRADTVKYPFEGYRVYKSTQSSSGPWTLLAEYDVVDSIGGDVGLNYEYKDDGLLNNIQYYYAVTAFSKADRVSGFPSQETSTSASALVVTPGTIPPSTIGQVTVVPNPYRGDVAYNTYDPPWEKAPAGRRWMEQDRRIQFTNLPQQCEVKIYTLSGDLVYTIVHDSQNQGYEDWNLTSSVGQAVASGIYLFTAEDKITGRVQVGKFVIIK